MRTSKPRLGMLAMTPLALLAACGGGGGGSDTASSGSSGQTQQQPPVAVTSSALEVPIAGSAVADCTDTGVGVVDSIIDTANQLAGGALPVAIPKLSDVIAQANLGKVPVIGGLVLNAGQLVPVSVDTVTGMLPDGVPSLGDLPVPAQLLTICSSLVAALPSGALDDPSSLVDSLGLPTAGLGVIPIFDATHDPVGVILATVPAGLVPNSGSGVTLPGVSTLPDLTKIVPVSPSSLPVDGDVVATLVGTALGILNGGGLLGGGLLGLVP